MLLQDHGLAAEESVQLRSTEKGKKNILNITLIMMLNIILKL